MSSPLAKAEPWSLVAYGYETTTKVAFEPYAREILRLIQFESGKDVLDVATGPGTLPLLIHDQTKSITAVDFSEEMLKVFRREIKNQTITNIETFLMDGQKLDLADNHFDFAFSMFGLMFFPDRPAGFRELYRTLKPGGRAAVSSWAPADKSPLFQFITDAIISVLPPSPEAPKSLGLDDPDIFQKEMTEAGFTDVEIHPFSSEWPVEDVDTFFEDVMKGSAPFVLMEKNLGDKWPEVKAGIYDYFKANLKTPTKLGSQAWIGVGTKGQTVASS